MRLSGSLAHQHWRTFLAKADNCSRFDIECTVRYDIDPHKVIRRHLREARRFQASHKRAHFVGHYSANDLSETVYLNKRISDRFGRIYDKGRESGLDHFRNAVRYEVEFKGKTAWAVAQNAAAEDFKSAWDRDRVAQFLKARGLSLPRRWEHRHHSDGTRSSRDSDKTLAWLKKCVRPCIISGDRIGRRQEFIEALGLSDLLIEKQNPRLSSSSKARKDYVN